MSSRVRRLALVGNHLPRRCGIATFTTHLSEAIGAHAPDVSRLVIPVDDRPEGYDYPDPVRFVLRQNELESYREAADFLDINRVDAVVLQHEFGIFGGVAGAHVLSLLTPLRMPRITTLHTVPSEPTSDQRAVLTRLADASDVLVVLANEAVRLLEEVYHVPRSRVRVIPHGIPDVPFTDPAFHKDRFGVEGKTVLLTLGLLGPGKGIEYVIDALPAILERCPDVVYIVLGATHPNILRHEGERYRLSLQQRARERGVEQHVLFLNRFVTEEELVECLGAADIYVMPYPNPDQIASGTLAYSIGAGKAVISTPYWYAKELLDGDRGVLVPFRSSSAIAEAVVHLIEHEAERQGMRKRAYLFARGMTWPKVAARYVELVESLLEDRTVRPRAWRARPVGARSESLPPINLEHMRRLTDGTGILQHAVFIAPNYDEGYTTDDNARALIVTALLEELGRIEGVTVLDLAARYLAFLWHAFNPSTGRFRNFMSYDRRWREDVGSGDSHGRALWALGTLLGRSRHEALRGTAARLFDDALPAAEELTSPRAAAFALLGLREYARRLAGDRVARSAGTTLADRLMASYDAHRGPDWEWFEDVLAYANATVPHALIEAGGWLEREDMVQVGLRTLDWLRELQLGESGQLVPIGTEGFYVRGGTRARFDQQPLEAQSMVSACVAAYHATGEERWRREARRAFEWFLGHNDLGLPLYDSFTGGCRDGLHAHGVNENQGAESTLAVLQSRIELQLVEEASAVGSATQALGAPREKPAEERVRARMSRVGARGWSGARETVSAE